MYNPARITITETCGICKKQFDYFETWSLNPLHIQPRLHHNNKLRIFEGYIVCPDHEIKWTIDGQTDDELFKKVTCQDSI